MSDNLVIGGATFTGVTGIKATDTSDNVLTFLSSGDRRPEAEENDVILIDFDGRILYSYSYTDFANLTELPTLPAVKYSFLQQDGWNWTLADAKTYVAKYKELVIGAQYTTVDSKDHVLLYVPENQRMYWNITINTANYGTGTGTITVDWGDNTEPTSLTDVAKNTTTSPTHVYSQSGLYDIKVSYSGGPTNYSRITNVHKRGWALAVTAKNTYAGYNYHPQGDVDVILLTGYTQCRGNMAQYCWSKAYVFPRGWTCGSNANWFSGSDKSKGIKYVSWNKEATHVAGGYNYKECVCLKRITLPETVTAIGAQAFYSCSSLSKLHIPSSVTSIAAEAFSGTSGLYELHFHPTTPPAVANANAFTNLPATCKIYVPTGYLTTYTTASNYPDSSTYTYVEE